MKKLFLLLLILSLNTAWANANLEGQAVNAYDSIFPRMDEIIVKAYEEHLASGQTADTFSPTLQENKAMLEFQAEVEENPEIMQELQSFTDAVNAHVDEKIDELASARDMETKSYLISVEGERFEDFMKWADEKLTGLDQMSPEALKLLFFQTLSYESALFGRFYGKGEFKAEAKSVELTIAIASKLGLEMLRIKKEVDAAKKAKKESEAIADHNRGQERVGGTTREGQSRGNTNPSVSVE